MSYVEALRMYPSRIMENRKGIEANVLGCLLQDMLLIKEYNVKHKDFLSDEGKFYFDIINHLSQKNITEPTDTDIRLLCSEELIKTYKEYGGFKRIEQFKKIVDSNNFLSYLDELYKRNLYISYYNDNIDLEKLIEIDLGKKKIEMSYIDLFEGQNMTSEEIVAFMIERQTQKDILSFDKTIEDEDGYIDDAFIDSLSEGAEMGVMMNDVGEDVDGHKINFLPSISKETLGLKRGTLNMIGAFVNVGKTAMITNMSLSLVEKGEKVLIITNEQKVKHFKQAFLVFVASQIMKEKSITKKKLKQGNFTDGEKAILRKAKEIYNERFAHSVRLCSIPDSNISMVNKFVRKYVLGQGYTTLVYDTFKMEYGKDGEVSYKDLIRDSRQLEIICKNNNLIGMSAIQLSQAYLGNLVLELSMLSNAKGVNEVLSDLYMMRSVYNELELNPKNDKYYIRPFKWEKDEDGKWEKKEQKITKDGTYRVLFITKTRDGQTYTDSQEAVLLRYFGSHGCFKEICLCNPQRRVVNEYTR